MRKLVRSNASGNKKKTSGNIFFAELRDRGDHQPSKELALVHRHRHSHGHCLLPLGQHLIPDSHVAVRNDDQ